MDQPSELSHDIVARDLLENLLEGCQVIGFDWTYLYVNDVVAQQARRARAELLGRTMMECFPGIEQSPMFSKLRRCMQLRVHDRTENEFTYPDGSVGWFELRFLPVPEGVCILSIDMTESRRALEALARTESQLLQMQKMEAVSRLAGGIAHDFNNLLSIIMGYAEFSLTGLKPMGELRENLEEIRKAGERGAALTRQLLTFSRQHPFSPRVLDLNEVVREVEPMFRRLLTEAVTIRIALAPDLGKVKADAGQLDQVLMNLVVNARDAMPEGGELVLETQNVELDADYASEHLGVQPGAYVMVAVSDTGTGMDRATQARVFEPFFTTKAAGRGTGLGLTTVFGIVRQSRGSVWIYSEPGRGTSVKVYLPRSEELVRDLPRPAPTPSVGGTETVLVVEDDEQLRALTASILERAGYRVLQAGSGTDALRESERHREPIHLLLSDVVMPRMSGPALAQRIVSLRPGIRIAFMSGYTEDAMLRQDLPLEGAVLLEKPITAESLMRGVRQALDAPSAG